MSAAGPKKLLVLTSTFPRWAGDTEPRFVEYLGHELAKSFDVVVLAPHFRGAKRNEIVTKDGRSISVHRFRYFFPALQSLAYEGGILSRIRRNPLRVLLVPFFIFAQLYAVHALHRRHHFGAIHAHWIIPQGLVATIYSWLSKQAPPVLITSHGGDLFALRGPVLTRLKRWVLTKATQITVVSEAMRSYATALDCDPDRIVVRSMGVDLRSTFIPHDSTASHSSLVFVGRLVEKKGVAYLIEAMATLIDQFPELRLTIIGDGPDRGSLMALADRYQLQDTVSFLGSVPNEELPTHLRAARIAVMPSVIAASGDQEGLGLVAVEAMGCGCAVVASDLPAVRDTVRHGDTGLMAEPGSSEDLAEKIALFLTDDELRQAIAANGRRYALEHFDWQIVGDDYARIISRMLDSSGD